MDLKKIICLHGGPGSGKSTVGAGLYYKLSLRGHICEMNREVIKDWIYEKRKVRAGDQSYIFAESARKERIYMENDIDFIITDSPLLLTHFYGKKYDKMEKNFNTSKVMLEHHHGYCKMLGYKVEHFFINRNHEYVTKGRFETKEAAINVDSELKMMLNETGIKYHTIDSGIDSVDIIINILIETKDLTKLD